MRSRVTMVLAVVAILLGGVLLVPTAYARLSAGDSGRWRSAAAPRSVAAPTPTAPPPPTLAAAPGVGDLQGRVLLAGH